MSASEVARLRQQIDREIEASRLAMNGYATVSSHEIITHHYKVLGTCLEQLQARIGDKAAVELLAQALEQQL